LSNGDVAFRLDLLDDFFRVRLFAGKIVDGNIGAFARVGNRRR